MEKKATASPYMSPSLLTFNHLYKEYNMIYHDAAQKLNLSNSAFDILYSICELGDGCQQKDICAVNYLPKQTVHSSIRNLEKNGYVTLSPGKGRSMHINLTPRGRELLERTIYPVVAAENASFSNMSEAECQQLLTLHQKYIRALRAEINKL